MISLVFGGEYEHWLERRRMPVDIKSPLVVRLARELAALRQTIFTHRDFAGHVQLERARHAKEGDKDPAAADRRASTSFATAWRRRGSKWAACNSMAHL